MIKNLLLVAWRNFKRDKWYSVLNLLGLTIGITFSIFLIFYVRDELSFDRFNKKADRIYRIDGYIEEQGKPPFKVAYCQKPLAPTLQREYPEVEEATRFMPAGKNMYKHGELHLYEDKVYYADSNVFRVFTFPFIQGDPRTALNDPKTMVLTQSTAQKFFGSAANAFGQSLENASGDVFKITGIVKDVPANSHIRFNMLLSANTLPRNDNNWGNFNVYDYVLLKPHTDPAAFEKKLLPMYDKYMASIFRPVNVKIHYVVHPITWIHLHSDNQLEPEELGSMSYVYIFSAVAFFLLIIACINYMNLTTARSARRAKEIGIRKVTGSTQPQLIGQFLLESTLTAIVGLLLSIGLIALLLPAFNNLAGKTIPFSTLLQPGTLGILLAIVVFVGFLGGSYPALYLAKFDPIHILKGNLAKSSSNVVLRRILVVTQFSIAMVMLICTIVVYNQLNYVRSKDLGFDKSQVITIVANSNKDISSSILAFKNEVRKNPHVLAAASSETEPGGPHISYSLFHIQTNTAYTDKAVENYGVDENYFKTLGMRITTGRPFTGLGDTLHSIIVNENFVHYFGWTNPIGKHVKYPGDTSSFYMEVVGVVRDFNQQSLYNPIGPLMLYYRPNPNHIQLKLDGKDIAGTIAAIQRTWRHTLSELPFEYTFLDQGFDSQYAADQRRGKLFTTFSVLTILITCLGLLGLIAFITQQRQKEISMRKVLGAGVGTLVTLITRNFIFLVGLSCLIAFPVAYMVMDHWLRDFHYTPGFSALPYLLAALTVLLITMATVIYHTMRAALVNPSRSLRSE
ncbi:MAG TPA: ABC transporter permease [Puia sp.]|nr:ABC transporter permease [Puia sp.]